MPSGRTAWTAWPPTTNRHTTAEGTGCEHLLGGCGGDADAVPAGVHRLAARTSLATAVPPRHPSDRRRTGDPRRAPDVANAVAAVAPPADDAPAHRPDHHRSDRAAHHRVPARRRTRPRPNGATRVSTQPPAHVVSGAQRNADQPLTFHAPDQPTAVVSAPER